MTTVPVVDRPREKLARVGAEALGDNELVALVIGAGTRSRGALDRKSTRLNSSHSQQSRMPSSA